MAIKVEKTIIRFFETDPHKTVPYKEMIMWLFGT
jgi:hypothetical protein